MVILFHFRIRITINNWIQLQLHGFQFHLLTRQLSHSAAAEKVCNISCEQTSCVLIICWISVDESKERENFVDHFVYSIMSTFFDFVLCDDKRCSWKKYVYSFEVRRNFNVFVLFFKMKKFDTSCFELIFPFLSLFHSLLGSWWKTETIFVSWIIWISRELKRKFYFQMEKLKYIM